MSKPYSGSPSLSRSGSPPLLRSASSSSIYSNQAERRTDDEKTMANLGGAPRPASPTREKEQAPHTPSSREQILPILNYCAASIMMTVVNKVSNTADCPCTAAGLRVSPRCAWSTYPPENERIAARRWRVVLLAFRPDALCRPQPSSQYVSPVARHRRSMHRPA